MTMRLLACFAMTAFAAGVYAADNPLPKTLMTERGKEIVKDDLASFGKDWKAAKGEWKPVDGGMKAKELKDDMHGAAARLPVKFKNAVIQFDFRLEGAKNCSLSVNDATGHVCRVPFNATGFSVNKDKHDKKDDTDKPAVLQRKAVTIEPGKWHTMVVEINGKEIVATLDGKETAVGEHAAIEKSMTNIGFTCAGESCIYRNLRIWEATPKADWKETKAKLKGAN